MQPLRILLSGACFAFLAPSPAAAQAPPTYPIADLGGIVVGSGAAISSVFLHGVPELNVFPTTILGAGPFQFLTFEMTGRLDLLRFDPTRPRRIATGDGLVRLALPNGGSVFHYRRASNPDQFGWMLVQPDGEVFFLVEKPALAGPVQDPFHPWIAASRDGSLLAVYTKLAAGGDVFLLSGSGKPTFGGGMSVEVGGPAALSVDPQTPTFADGALFFGAFPSTLYRADTTAPSTAAPVPLPSSGPSPAFIEHEFAVSDDGSILAVLAGSAEKNVNVYVVTSSGAATNLTQSTGEYSPPGYAPSEAHGPFLLLTPDGSRIAYIKDMGGSNELFLRDVPVAPPLQVTSDAWFDVSIDHPGSLGVAIPPTGDILFLAAPLDTFENSDVYSANAAGGTLVVQNFSGTGGTTPPFPNTATLDVADSFQILGAPHRIVVVTTPTGQDLISVGTTGSSTLLSAAGPIQGLVGSNDGRVFFAATPAGGHPTIYVLDGTSGTTSLQVLLPSPMPGVSFEALTPSPSGGELAVIAALGAGLDLGLRLDATSGTYYSVLLGPAVFVRAFAWSPLEHLGFAAGSSPSGPFYPVFDVLPGLCVPMNVTPGAVLFLR
jgi:hypothetical protein